MNNKMTHLDLKCRRPNRHRTHPWKYDINTSFSHNIYRLTAVCKGDLAAYFISMRSRQIKSEVKSSHNFYSHKRIPTLLKTAKTQTHHFLSFNQWLTLFIDSYCNKRFGIQSIGGYIRFFNALSNSGTFEALSSLLTE